VRRSPALAALVAASVVLLALELGLGALDSGEYQPSDPCTTVARFEGSGVDAAVQRVLLSGLNGAACELGTTREELVLSFSDATPTERIPWTRERGEDAVRAALVRAADDARARGELGAAEALVLREVAERLPLDLVFAAAERLRGVLG
jgi:hypothetical protein